MSNEALKNLMAEGATFITIRRSGSKFVVETLTNDGENVVLKKIGEPMARVWAVMEFKKIAGRMFNAK